VRACFSKIKDGTMYEFQIPSMSCGHCVKAVTAAVQAADPQAQVEVDLPQHKLQVHSQAPRDAVVAQLVEAGYTPA
jgi:copper chaperone